MCDKLAVPRIDRSETTRKVLIAVDIGNSGIKFGKFDRDAIGKGLFGEGPFARDFCLPTPKASFELPIVHATGEFDLKEFAEWCETNVVLDTHWFVGSVHRGACALLTNTVTSWAKQLGVEWPVRALTYQDLPLQIRVDEPANVGIDRLLAALAANQIRHENRAAIVIDLGTAITVDLVDADGAFAGGAILPGIGMAGRALRDQTDALPRIVLGEPESTPSPIGKSTQTAIEAGLYWGTVGAVTELAARISATLSSPPQIFITGGAAPVIVDLLSPKLGVEYMPHLVLAGIALLATPADEA